MIKVVSIALAGVLGIAGLASTQAAIACPTVGFAAPGIAVMPAGYVPAHYRPYYGHDRWHRYELFDRFHHHRWY